MKKYYSNDDIYISARGCILDTYPGDKYYFRFKWIEGDDGTNIDLNSFSPKKQYVTYYSPNKKSVWEELALNEGIIIDFIYGPAYVKADFGPPIVEIRCEGKEVLPFEEGKEALLDYLSN